MLKPNIYFASAISDANSDNLNFAKEVASYLNQFGRVMTENLSKEDVLAWEAEQKAKGVNVATRDFGWLADSDLMIADISKGSIGVGSEVNYALNTRRIPVLAVYKKGPRPSQMIANFKHPLLKCESYESLDDLKLIINNFVNNTKILGKLRKNLLICDGIDGCGKGVISSTIGEWAVKNNMPVFNATQFSIDNGVNPTWEDAKKTIGNGGMLLVAEPTHAEMGSVVRDQLIKNGSKHSVLSTAYGYSLDREILFMELIEPAIEAGILVILDRGVLTTQVYQPVQGEMFEGYDRESIFGLIRGLPGNQYEMDFVPGLIILPEVDVDIAQDRLKNREKDDNALFEKHKFQAEVAKVYSSGRIEDWYERRGSKIIHMSQNEGEGPEVTVERTLRIWNDYFESLKG
ncbi:hypothetical protein HOF78_03205 [Candidatus Woesearchaeota archaeon]|jgi:thymidylate kinase|nr:hypothetical protein [Candidatus Woesearchaeota archaeon]MBT6044622.1 hypothetical protein [Candidatus Woesearchaeota archaeon]